MNSSTQTYPTRLAEILDQEGRKQSWLSRVTGISESQLSHYRHGLHVPDDKRVLIAEALRREISDVFPPEGS